jgi:hypothetical protein
MEVIKEFKGVVIVLLIETFFYIIEAPVDLEMFFMLFSLIFLILFMHNLFNNIKNDPLRGVGGTKGTGGNSFNSKWSEVIYGTDKFDSRDGGGLLDKSSITLLIFVILNVIGYIIVMLNRC